MSDVAPSRFHQFWTARPMTLVLVVVLIGLHVGVRLKTTPELGRAEAYRDLGVLEIQEAPEHPQLAGPFDLWGGQWWRIPLGGLHHTGWWHLAIGSAAILYLGRLLEPKISAVSYLCFLLGALVITTIPRWQGGGSVPVWFMGTEPLTGITGVVFAQYGALLMLRRNDRRLTLRFGEGAILLGIVLGLGSMAFSTIGLVTHIDNLAHLAGFPYGLLWGALLSTSPVPRRVLVTVFLGAHLLLWPVFDRLMHPVENGRYQWWLAERTDDPDAKKEHYQSALRLNPNLEYPWLALAELELQNQRPAEAWRTLLNGLEYHPDLKESAPLARSIWEELSSTEDRRTAWREADRKLSDQPHDWSHRLISPRQAAAFHMEEESPLKAWFFLMRHLREQPPPKSKWNDGEIAEWTADLWQHFRSEAERHAALKILDEQLGENRRAWHLAIIPKRDLIPHYQNLGEAIWAWQALMEELRDDPSFHQHGKQVAQELWRMFPTELRRQRARRIVKDVFGVEELNWQIELGILSEERKQRYRLDQSVELPVESVERPEPLKIMPVPPDDPESAGLGKKL